MPHCLSQIIWHDGYSYVIGCGLIQTKATANDIIFSAWFDFIYKKIVMKYGLGEILHYLTKEFRQKKNILRKKKKVE